MMLGRKKTQGLPEADVVIMGREGCHLCEVAEDAAKPVAAERGASFATCDVGEREDWLAEYSDQVPVIFVRGRRHAVYSVDPDRLRRALG